MRLFLLLTAIVGSVALADGQAPRNTDQMWANEVMRSSRTHLNLRGAVEITHGATTITADEANVQADADGTMHYELQGNVQFTVRTRANLDQTQDQTLPFN